MVLGALCASENLVAQSNLPFEVHGNFQLDAQYYLKDSLIGAPDVPEQILSNGFGNLIVSRDRFSAGIRYESYLNPMLGFDPRYKGSGITHRFATYQVEDLEITLGNFYEQFGSGLLLRSYEERSLGIDNAFDGLRVRYTPAEGIQLKALIGEQRFFFEKGPGIVRGVDAEVSLSEAIASMANYKTKIIIGTSAVSKYQKADDPLYKIPESVLALAGRTTINRGGFRFYGEYAFKSMDPSFDNSSSDYPSGIYKNGQAIYSNLAYTKKGLGASVSLKHIDNMSFRSDRNASLTILNINYLPSISKQQTYRLATLYPYAAQSRGEAGISAEVFYNFKKDSPLGGKTGTYVAFNYSKATGLDTTVLKGDGIGYRTDIGQTWSDLIGGGSKRRYFEELSIELQKKISSDLKITVTGIYTVLDQNVMKTGKEIVSAYTNVFEAQYKISKKHSIRTELQHVYSEQDRGNWALAMIEYSISPKWFFSFFDEYNYGNDDASKRFHYPNISFAFTKGSNRISMGYGKQREGLLCVGGVCRNVPASNGVSFSVTSSF